MQNQERSNRAKDVRICLRRRNTKKGDYQNKQGIDSWVLEFAADLYTKYAIVVLDQGLLCSLGKDTGILPGSSSAAEKLGLSTTNQVPEGKNGCSEHRKKEAPSLAARARGHEREGTKLQLMT